MTQFKYIAVIILVVLCIWLYSSNQSLKEQREQLSLQLKSTQETLIFMQTENIRINEINQINSRHIQQLVYESNTIRESIKEALKNETCTTVTIPVDVVDQLRSHAERIRTADSASQSD
ncbi:hypothetical protein [Zophobihabitans entericus]|uniref:DUF2570 domain-containing protein n=1 Tax=Zophobihabitans entericus TaxID=1635327 RepID=A0A6G9I9V6_9GAMM|nr:hypothetical protein [Zophobihabitans entericus]QIQ21018.1 hypothetical protein IPMB12_04585 [Zophobihabitans entericus]